MFKNNARSRAAERGNMPVMLSSRRVVAGCMRCPVLDIDIVCMYIWCGRVHTICIFRREAIGSCGTAEKNCSRAEESSRTHIHPILVQLSIYILPHFVDCLEHMNDILLPAWN